MNPAHWSVYGALVLMGLAITFASIVGEGRLAAEALVAGIGFLVYAAMGGLIIRRRDGHPTGWLLTLVGVAIVFADGFAGWPGMPAGLSSWVASWSWTVVFGLFALLALTFPSGRLPRGRNTGRNAGRAAVGALVVLVAAAPFTETLGGSEISNAIPNPVGFIPGWLSWVSPLGTFLILLGAVISLVVRRRRAVGVERAQLSWVVFAMLLLAMVIAGTFAFILGSIAVGAGDPGDDAWTVAYIGMIIFPNAFAVAILRYKLFEIDRIISRTVSYALVAGMLAGVFAVGAIGLPQLLDLPDDSSLLIAGATLAVAALFNPLRRRVQGWVDRRFNRTHFDAQREVDRLAVHLRHAVEPGEVVRELIDVASKTMQPAVASVWIKDQ